MVEIELSVFDRQCLEQRIPSRDVLTQEAAAWETSRNASHATVNWHFTTDQARHKLHQLDPFHVDGLLVRAHPKTAPGR